MLRRLRAHIEGSIETKRKLLDSGADVILDAARVIAESLAGGHKILLCGNGFGFAGIFERQVQALGQPGDVVIGLSTSGNSENVLRAIDYARAHGMRTVGLTGDAACTLAEAAQIVIRVPSSSTQFIQESHIMIGHILCDVVEQTLYGPAGS